MSKGSILEMIDIRDASLRGPGVGKSSRDSEALATVMP